MPKLKIFLVLLLSTLSFAVPFNVETVKEGSGEPVRAGQLIKVHYKGYLLNDLKEAAKADSIRALEAKSQVKGDSASEPSTEISGPVPFGDSYEGEPLEFTLGMGQVIAGWEKGIAGMKLGEIRKLVVPAVMAYGENSLDGIPPNSDLYFEVELVHAEKAMEPDLFPKDVNKLTWKNTGKGLKIYDEKVGSGKPAIVGSTMKMHYTGWLVSGRKFGSSKDLGKPLESVLGAGKMIKGLETGLDGMKEGGVRWFSVSPNMGYGATAYTMIPPNSTLIFRVEMVSVDIDDEVAARMDFFPDTASLKLEKGSEGLRYAIVQKGDTTMTPAASGQKARVHYTGWLTNGYKFDSSRDRDQEFAFPIGGGKVIRGWDLGVAGMYPGEKRILVIPPGLGYGSRAAGPIPGGSTLIFAVEYLGD